jgi:hypothetical protein
MIAIGNQTYVNPRSVLENIVDDDGQKIQIGD